MSKPPAIPGLWRRRSAAMALGAIGGLMLLGVLATLLSHFARQGGRSDGGVLASMRDVYSIEAPLLLSAVPSLWLEHGRLTLDRAQPGGAAGRLVLERPEFRLDPSAVDTDSKTPVFGPVQQSPLVAQLATLGFETVRIERGNLRVGTPGHTAAVITDIRGDLIRSGSGRLALKGTAQYERQAIEIDIAVGGLQPATVDTAVRRSGAAEERTLTARFRNTSFGELGFTGRIDAQQVLRLRGQVNARLSDLYGAMRWLGYRVGDLPIGRAATANADIEWSEGKIALAVTGLTVDHLEPATGALSLSAVAGRPRIEGTLAFPALDLTPYFSSPTAAATSPPSWSEITFGSPAQRDLEADLRLSAGSVVAGALTLGRTAATIHLSNGLLDLDLADLSWRGTQGSLKLIADPTSGDGRLAVRGRLTAPDPSALFGWLIDQPPLSGPSTWTFDVKGDGLSFARMSTNMVGRMTGTSLPGSARALVDPARFVVTDASGRPRATAQPLSLGPTAVAVDQWEARLGLETSRVVIERLVTRSRGSSFVMTGEVDRASGQIDARAVVHVGPIADAKGRPTADLGPPRQSITVSGPWRQPALAVVDPGAVRP